MKNSAAAKQDLPRNTGLEAVYLIACALHGKCPELPASTDLSALYQFCKRQSVTAITAMALEEYWRSDPPADPAQTHPWKQAKEKAIRKNILLNAERERILEHLEQIGCWYMPLKGSLLQFDYPKFGMRQMSDNDILFDGEMQGAVYEFMCGNQYEPVVYQIGNHDEYTKPPVYNFEMHRSLFSSVQFPELEEYYRDIKRLLRKDEGNQYGYHLSDDDFYIYMTAHAYKHYSDSGTGIRNLVDVYVYLRAHGEKLDWTYIEKELRSLNIWDFECRCRQLSQKLFACPVAEPRLTAQEMQMLDFFFQSGTFGTQTQKMDIELQKLKQDGKSAGKGTKLRYVFQRLFPSAAFLSVENPELKDQRWKTPFVALKRLFRGFFRQPMRTLKELLALIKAKPTE